MKRVPATITVDLLPHSRAAAPRNPVPQLLQRKLAVIMAADVVGYSRLMERDEADTLSRLKANRQAIFDPQVAAHRGRIVKLMGDGALVEFGSVVDALVCAREIQHATDIEASTSAHPIRYRIGVTLGEVIVEGDDIYGDGVNIAARLEGLASTGGIALSRSVRDHALGKGPFEFEDLGEHTVKNIERPIQVFSLVHGRRRHHYVQTPEPFDLRAPILQHEWRS